MLEIQNLYSGYGLIDAVKGISLHVSENEIISIIGANGAGKTTTLKTISGLIQAKKGDILFLGESISQLEAHSIVERGITHVPEGRRLFGRMPVYENLEMGGFPKRIRKNNARKIEELMERFPILKARKNQIAATLSGGEQQMLAVARALMSEPRLLLLDEPSLGLAPMVIAEIHNIIKNIHQQGATILLVEQNVNLALKLSHRIYIMEFGEIVAEGTPEELGQHEIIREAYLGKKNKV
jgi:branched-chain amino acid transport system ATP-binding protein